MGHACSRSMGDADVVLKSTIHRVSGSLRNLMSASGWMTQSFQRSMGSWETTSISRIHAARVLVPFGAKGTLVAAENQAHAVRASFSSRTRISRISSEDWPAVLP